MKILLVDDNKPNRKLMRRIIDKIGHQFLEADNAQSGIDLAKSEQPVLILMDINLPGMDGLSATRILKEDPATTSIPVIAFTACAMKGDRESMLEAGCDDYISKPINFTDFVSRINWWLEKKNNPAADHSDGVRKETKPDDR